MSNDLLSSIGDGASKLEQAAKSVLREALDSVDVHPCDEGDDAIAAKKLSGEMKELLTALTGHSP